MAENKDEKRKRFLLRFSCNNIKPEPERPNRQIVYTSSDGNIVIPDSDAEFGANIVSNTYENGKGVIKFDGDVTSIGADAFMGCTGLTSINIPDSVTSIGVDAFYMCKGLTSITIPNSVTMIENQAFRSCTGLTSITMSNSVTSIGNSAFYFCDSLTSINIPDSVTSVEESTFYGCIGLTSITIPNSVTSIGESAFWHCTNLTILTVESITPPTFGKDMLDGCSKLSSIKVPASSVDDYKTATGWSDYADKIVAISE